MKLQTRIGGPTLLVLSLIVVNIALLGQNMTLRSRLLALAPDPGVPVQVGQLIGELTGSGWEGRELVVDLAERDTTDLVYFFSPRCQFCKAMAPTLRSVVKRLPSEVTVYGVVPVGFERAEVQGHLADVGLADLEPIAVDFSKAKELGLLVTPTVLVVEHGSVRLALRGMWNEEDKQAVLDAVRPRDAM